MSVTQGPRLLFRGCTTTVTIGRSKLPTRWMTMAAMRSHSTLDVGIAIEIAKSAISRADCVCFDVDSTVITEEGIDELAAYAGKKDAVAALTARAMGGSLPFHVALDERLRIIRPTQRMLESFLRHHPFALTPGVEEVVAKLHQRRTDVYLVSGGFTQMIAPVADRLSIPGDRVYANTILFDAAGEYIGFDPSAPTSRDGGKAKVVQQLREGKAGRGSAQRYNCIVVIGDGATDMQARPYADAFIGFGGVVDRETVRKGADWYISSFQQILAVLSDAKSATVG